MKILNQPVSDMYLWSIALILVLAILSSYTLHTFPLALIAAVVICSATEILIRRLYLKHVFKIPWSGIITGLIIGSIAPINSPLLLVTVAAIMAIISKFFIQYKNSNILNPAAIGLLVALPIFGLGDEWWVASNYNVLGIAITLTPVLIILAYEAKRLPAALSFVAGSLIIDIAAGGILSPSNVVASIFSINYFFAFVMLVEPKTSPNGRYAQIAYGGAISVLFLAFALLSVPYSFLVALLSGNVCYAVYRMYGKR